MPVFSAIAGAMGAGAASDAADAQSQAIQYGMDLLTKAYGTSRADLLPFINQAAALIGPTQNALTGYDALIKAGPGDFATSPYADTFKTNMNQIMGDATNALVARGLVTGQGGGAVGKALQRYGATRGATELANQRGNWLNEWLQSKVNPTAQGVSFAQDLQRMYLPSVDAASRNALAYGADMAGLATQKGEAQASGILGSNQAWGNALTGIGNTAGFLTGYGMGGGFRGSNALNMSGMGAGTGAYGNPHVVGPYSNF